MGFACLLMKSLLVVVLLVRHAGVRPGTGSRHGADDFKRDPSSGKIVVHEEEDPLGFGKKRRSRGHGAADGYNSDDSDFDDLKVGWVPAGRGETSRARSAGTDEHG